MRLASLLLTAALLLTACTGPRSSAQPQDTDPSAAISGERSQPEDTAASEPESESEAKPVPEETEGEFLLCSYLPVASLSEPLEDLQTNIEALDYLILNTGVYWNSEGMLEISEEFLSVRDSLEGSTELWCTVNPKGELIREGSAGATIDTEEAQEQLSQSIANFASEYQLAGIDIDWEFPLETEWADFSAFLVELEGVLSSADVQLSLALYPEDISLSQQAITALDRVHVMAYDQFDEQGFHSTLQTAQDAIDYFINLGFAPSQLCLGIPAYGRPLDGSAQWVFYRDIDPDSMKGKNPNLVGDIYFNSPTLALEKQALAKEKKLSGVMIYQLLCDRTDQKSLIYTLSLSQ